jgi:hypothetical protein
MDERLLLCTEERPLVGWRIFRVRETPGGFLLSAPLIHNPDYELFPTRVMEAVCYEFDHPAPASQCRCGLYVSVDGTLDSLHGYLRDSSHDPDIAVLAQVAGTGRAFLDARGARLERLLVTHVATSADAWPVRARYERAMADLIERYGVEICDLGAVPAWITSNVRSKGAPSRDAAIDLDALVDVISRGWEIDEG